MKIRIGGKNNCVNSNSRFQSQTIFSRSVLFERFEKRWNSSTPQDLLKFGSKIYLPTNNSLQPYKIHDADLNYSYCVTQFTDNTKKYYILGTVHGTKQSTDHVKRVSCGLINHFSSSKKLNLTNF